MFFLFIWYHSYITKCYIFFCVIMQPRVVFTPVGMKWPFSSTNFCFRKYVCLRWMKFRLHNISFMTFNLPFCFRCLVGALSPSIGMVDSDWGVSGSFCWCSGFGSLTGGTTEVDDSGLFWCNENNCVIEWQPLLAFFKRFSLLGIICVI